MFKYVLMLTATPLQNRLWDIYSLVDLLSVARGHQNPFGSEGVFARTFIANDRTQARHLAANMREKFRSIVYGYMSRIRRADANLHFPERVVQLHKVDPEPEELELIDSIASAMAIITNAKSQVEAAVLSPSQQYLAVCLETKNWLGLRTRQAGLLYSIQEQEAVGRIVAGKRGAQGWLLEKTL